MQHPADTLEKPDVVLDLDDHEDLYTGKRRGEMVMVGEADAWQRIRFRRAGCPAQEFFIHLFLQGVEMTNQSACLSAS